MNLDYIQVSLRKFCLAHGSSLIFASSNQNSNIELTYNYVLHRLYDQDFPHPSNTSDKEALFIPTGYDTSELIESAADLKQFLARVQMQMKANNEVSDDVTFTDVVKRPVKKILQGKEEEKEVLNVKDWKS
jgi:hypothetical protein